MKADIFNHYFDSEDDTADGNRGKKINKLGKRK